MYECTRELEDSVYHNTTPHEQPRGLEYKAGETREHDSRRKHRMSREPPGYYFGKRVLRPECSCRWPSLERRAVHFDFSYGAASIYRDAGISLSEDKTVYCTKLLLEREERDGETIR